VCWSWRGLEAAGHRRRWTGCTLIGRTARRANSLLYTKGFVTYFLGVRTRRPFFEQKSFSQLLDGADRREIWRSYNASAARFQ